MKSVNEKNRNIISVAAIIIIMYWVSQNLSLGVGILLEILNVMSPVLLGGAIAFVLYLPMRRYLELLSRIKSKHMEKMKEVYAFMLAVISIIGLLYLILMIVIPELINSFSMLTTAIPDTYDKIYEWAVENQERFPKLKEYIANMQIDWSKLFENALNFLGGGVAGVFDTTFNVVAIVLGGIYDLLMAIIIAMYLLLNRRGLAEQVEKFLRAYFPTRAYAWTLKFGRVCNDAFSQYVIGKCLDALVIGLMCFIGMRVFGFSYAAMISVIIGVTAMVPIIGGYIGMAIGAVLILVVDHIEAVWFIVFVVVLQLVEGNLIYPKIMGDTIGLPAMWIIIAITVGGGMFGFLGMLLAVPVFSVIYTLLKESVDNRLAEKNT